MLVSQPMTATTPLPTNDPAFTAVIRPIDLATDSQRVCEIISQIWHGGGPALVEAKYGQVGGKPWQLWMSQMVIDDFKSPHWNAFVVEHDGIITGFCSYSIDRQRSRGTVGFNGVAAECQGKGLGSAMLTFVMDKIRSSGVTFAAVVVADNEAHAPARRVYEKHGFEKITGNHFLLQKL